MKRIVLFTALLALPVWAQVDFTGEWAPAYHEDGPERLPGPELGDYMGIPLSDAGRLRADSYDADRISVVTEYQCRPHSSDYGMRGLGNLRVTRDIDLATQNLVAFHTYMPAWGSVRTIWLDGRPHPPAYAEHTFQGFSTGVWEGNMLTITTTHLKANYLRRNGVASSDKRIVTEHWTRHGDFLTVVVVVEDPVMLTEPLVRSENWYLDPGQKIPPSFCEYAARSPRARRLRPAPPDRQERVLNGSSRMVRPPRRSHPRRREDHVSRIPQDHAQAHQPRRPKNASASASAPPWPIASFIRPRGNSYAYGTHFHIVCSDRRVSPGVPGGCQTFH